MTFQQNRQSVLSCGARYAVAWGLLAVLGFIPESATSQQTNDPSTPEAAHERLATYVGDWQADLQTGSDNARVVQTSGTGSTVMYLDGRFLVTHVNIPEGIIEEAYYTLGCDTRHGEYQITAMDNTGTHSVTARGKQVDDGKIPMYGVDDDPTMTAMGLEKEFVFEYDFSGPDAFSIQIRFIDTCTPERIEHPFLTFAFTR